MVIKITNQKHGTLTEQDLIELARLLIKGGYTVRKSKERPSEKGSYQHFVEAEGAKNGT